MYERTPRLVSPLPFLAALILLAPTAGSGAAAQDLLADPARPAADRERDPGSKPLEVFAWLGIGSGMTVGDVIPGGGYNTHILAGLVGASGRVHAVGTDDESGAALEARLRAAGIVNAEVHRRFGTVAEASIDIYVIVRNVHDMLIPEVAARYGMEPDPIFSEILRTLKPGGIVGVVDSRKPGEGVDPDTHRISEAMVIAELQARGLEYVDRSELLAVPGDDPADAAWGRRHEMDRLLLKFRKPAG